MRSILTVSAQFIVNTGYDVAKNLGLHAPIMLASTVIAKIRDFWIIPAQPEVVPQIDVAAPSPAAQHGLPTIDSREAYLRLYNQALRLNRYPLANLKEMFNGVMEHHRLFVGKDGLLTFDEDPNSGLRYSPEEALTIARHLFQMIKNYHPDKLLDKWMLATKGIYCILKPWINRNSSDDLLALKWEYLLYCRHISRISNNPPQPRSPDEQATLIQRAFRQHAYRKRAKNLQVDHTAFKLFAEDKSLVPFLHPPLPEPINFLTGQQKKAWAVNNQQRLDGHADMIAESVTYRSHNQFMHQLKRVVKRFNEYVHSLPKDNRDYLLVVPQKCGSNRWATALALPFLTHEPSAIVDEHTVKAYVQQHPNIKHAVYIDDAFYSGRQMGDLLVLTQCKLPQIVIAPFYQSYGLCRIGSSTIKFLGERMIAPYEYQRAGILSQEQLDEFNRLVPSRGWTSPANKAGVYFQHRMADEASVYLQAVHEAYPDLLPQVPDKPYREKP